MHTPQRTVIGHWQYAFYTVGALVVLGMVALPWPCVWALDDEAARATLKDLPGVEVGVGEVTPEIAQHGITTQQVHGAVERQLRRAGIPVFTSQDAHAPQDMAYFTVSITTLRHEGMYAYSVDLAVYQATALLRDPVPRSLPTWSVGSIGLLETTSLGEIVKSVGTHVDQFIQAYRAVNPRARAGDAAATSRTRTRRVQERLRAAGFAPGSLDGQLGPQTRQALRHYQHAKGIRVTGTLDTRTLKALGLQ